MRLCEAVSLVTKLWMNLAFSFINTTMSDSCAITGSIKKINNPL